MKRFLLLPLLAALALPTAVNANVDPKVHKLCLPATDYFGCVKAMTTKSTDIPNIRIIEGEKEITGNSCPKGYAYSGGGYCSEIICSPLATPKDLRGMGQECKSYSFRHRYAYVAHTRPMEDGTMRAPKQIADAIGHDLQTKLVSYARFITKDLKKAFDLGEV